MRWPCDHGLTHIRSLCQHHVDQVHGFSERVVTDLRGTDNRVSVCADVFLVERIELEFLRWNRDGPLLFRRQTQIHTASTSRHHCEQNDAGKTTPDSTSLFVFDHSTPIPNPVTWS